MSDKENDLGNKTSIIILPSGARIEHTSDLFLNMSDRIVLGNDKKIYFVVNVLYDLISETYDDGDIRVVQYVKVLENDINSIEEWIKD